MSPQSDGVTLEVDGVGIAAQRGESIAAALARAGLRDLRTTLRGEPRGLFCGMGVCQECLVSIDGVHNLQACMRKVEGPHVVRRQQFPGAAPQRSSAPIIGAADLPARRPDVLVIGAGAGGLSAAAAAAEAGATVLLLDERPAAGGQFFKQPSPHRGWTAAFASDPQFAGGRALIERAKRAGVEMLQPAAAWGAFAPKSIAAATPEGALLIEPRRLIVASGAFERALPLPGWTLPGVMTTGAAQTMLRSDGVLAGRRILVCGNGPLNLQVALELARAGAEVAAVAELAPRPGPAQAAALARMLAGAPRLAWQGWQMLQGLRRAGVEVLYEHVLARIEPQAGGLRATLRQSRTGGAVAERQLTVDVVSMGYGFTPSNELLLALGCEHDFDVARGQLVTRRNTDCETSVAGVHAVGDCCGLGGAWAACAEGVIAGAAAARALGLGGAAASGASVSARAQLARHRRFQAGLWQLFAAPHPATALATADTIICRCEDVSLGALEAALADGVPSIGEVKRRTRLGMGRCQGRYCAPLLATLLAQRQNRAIDQHAFFAPRAPVRPMAIADLVRAAPAARQAPKDAGSPARQDVT